MNHPSCLLRLSFQTAYRFYQIKPIFVDKNAPSYLVHTHWVHMYSPCTVYQENSVVSCVGGHLNEKQQPFIKAKERKN